MKANPADTSGQLDPKLETDVIYNMDCIDALRSLPDNSIHCCVTSPPYYGLRDYGMDGQIGREETPERYIMRLTAVFNELLRVLRPDGTFWLNISDTYCGTGNKGGYGDPKYPTGRTGDYASVTQRVEGVKAKDLIGIPWMLAFSLRTDGWYLRNDIIWEKANPMPESVRDRCSRSYEHIFLLTKSRKYYFDHLAISEPIAATTAARLKAGRGISHKYADSIPGQTVQAINKPRAAGQYSELDISPFRNKRDVWRINTVPYSGAHFAAFPPKLAETCILAGCPENGIVIDPFFGSGTTGLAAKGLNRQYIGVELNPEYCQLAIKRIGG